MIETFSFTMGNLIKYVRGRAGFEKYALILKRLRIRFFGRKCIKMPMFCSPLYPLFLPSFLSLHSLSISLKFSLLGPMDSQSISLTNQKQVSLSYLSLASSFSLSLNMFSTLMYQELHRRVERCFKNYFFILLLQSLTHKS